MTDDVGSVIGTFTEADDGIWEQSPNAPTARPDPELGSLLKTGKTLLEDVDKTIANVDALTARANSPASLQDLLEAQARRRVWAADAIRGKLRSLENARLAAKQQADARAVETQLRAAAVRLDAAGLTTSTPPTSRRPSSTCLGDTHKPGSKPRDLRACAAARAGGRGKPWRFIVQRSSCP